MEFSHFLKQLQTLSSTLQARDRTFETMFTELSAMARGRADLDASPLQALQRDLTQQTSALEPFTKLANLKVDNPLHALQHDLTRPASALEPLAKLAADLKVGSPLQALEHDLTRHASTLEPLAKLAADLKVDSPLQALQYDLRQHASALGPLTNVAADLRVNNPTLAYLREANVGISNILTAQGSLAGLAKMAEGRESIAAMLRHLAPADTAESIRLALDSTLTHQLSVSVAAELRVAEFASAPYKAALGLNPGKQRGLDLSLRNLAESYSNLCGAFAADPDRLLRFTPQLGSMPATELYAGAELRRSLSQVQEDRNESQREVLHGTLSADGEETLEGLLADISSDLLDPLEGARVAIDSFNPDRTRHVAVSLRELFTQVLHRLAPDDRIRSWTTDRTHYDEKGRPTRRARLLFLYAPVNDSSLEEFVIRDVEAALEFLGLFHGGTHRVASSYTDPQLRALLFRMEALLRFLLRLARLN